MNVMPIKGIDVTEVQVTVENYTNICIYGNSFFTPCNNNAVCTIANASYHTVLYDNMGKEYQTTARLKYGTTIIIDNIQFKIGIKSTETANSVINGICLLLKNTKYIKNTSSDFSQTLDENQIIIFASGTRIKLPMNTNLYINDVPLILTTEKDATIL